MIKQGFKIFNAISSGSFFLRRNCGYLLKFSIIPLILHIAGNIFVQIQRPDASLFEIYLWNLPAVAAFGWFVFIQTRLIFLGERLDNIPENQWYKEGRINSMHASIIIFIFFNMFVTFSSGVMVMTAIADQANEIKHSLAGAITTLVTLLMFFGVRYAFLPILAAVHFPLKIFMKKIVRPMISVQVIGASAMVMLPVAIISQGLLYMILPVKEILTTGFDLGMYERVMISILSGVVSLASTSFINIVLTYAVRQMILPTIAKEEQ